MGGQLLIVVWPVTDGFFFLDRFSEMSLKKRQYSKEAIENAIKFIENNEGIQSK